MPNNAKKLRQNFNLTEEELRLAFALLHKVAYEPYVKAFQYEIVNLILYTNKKLFKLVIVRTTNVPFVTMNQKH